MTYLEKAIQKAIGGGYKSICSNCQESFGGEHKQTRIGNRYCTLLPDLNKVFLDPLFWQSLGKALGWRNIRHTNIVPHPVAPKEYSIERDEEPRWSHEWHRLIDHIAAGDHIESFFKQLLS